MESAREYTSLEHSCNGNSENEHDEDLDNRTRDGEDGRNAQRSSGIASEITRLINVLEASWRNIRAIRHTEDSLLLLNNPALDSLLQSSQLVIIHIERESGD